MDTGRFDRLTRLLGASIDRRAGVLGIAGGLGALAAARLANEEAAAAPAPAHCLANGRRCGKHSGANGGPCKKCCSRYSTRGNKHKRCTCRPDGMECKHSSQCCNGICDSEVGTCGGICTPLDEACNESTVCCGDAICDTRVTEGVRPRGLEEPTICCLPLLAQCEESFECCGEAVCDEPNVPSATKRGVRPRGAVFQCLQPFGGACDSTGECASGLTCIGNVCTESSS